MELVMDRWQRRMVFGVMPLVMVALVVLPLVAFWGDLPDTVATRFHPNGEATASMPRATWAIVQSAVVLIAAGALVRIGRRPTPDAPAMAATASFVGFLVGLLSCFLVLANEGHADWRDVELGGGAIAGALGGALGWTVPVVLLARRIAPPRAPHDVRAEPFGPDERPAWFGRTSSVGFAVAGAANVALGVVVALTSQVWVGILLVAIGGLLATFTSVVVTVDERGVGVRSGVVRWLGVRLPLSRIEEASRADVRPLAWGGWGYRGSVRLFRRAAWVLRAGEGLQLQLQGGGRFVVSVDGADEAAAVVNGLLARRAAVNPAG